jgi:predicted transporter
LIFLAVVAAVFWNWNSIQSMNWSILSLPENPSLQIILILVAMIVILFAYMAYKAKEPSIMRGN